MDKIFCRRCFVELPGHARFCHLCGASQAAQPAAHGDISPPGTIKGFNTGFALASADKLHSDDATLPSRDALSTVHAGERPSNVSPHDSSGKLQAVMPNTAPALFAAPEMPLNGSSSGNAASVTGNDEFTDIDSAIAQRRREELAAYPTTILKQDEHDDDDVAPLPLLLEVEMLHRAQHQQAQMQRAQHQQPQMQRAQHQQAQMQRAQHQQPQMQRAQHQQAHTIRAVHKQPIASRAFFATHKQSVRYSLLGTCGVLIVAIAVLLTIPLFKTEAQVSKVLGSPALAAVNASSVFPGGSVTLRGSGFTPGATVTLASDGDPLAQNDGQMLASLSSLASTTMNSLSQKALLDTNVQANGTFEVIILIPQTWQAGSTHKIQAAESDGGKTAFMNVTVLAQPISKPTPKPATNPNPVPTPATNPNPASQSVADQNPVAQPVANQNPTPTPIVTNEQPTPASGPDLKSFCLSVSENTLSFDATIQGNNPDNQIVSLRNDTACESGDWSASTDASWLNISADKGHLASGDNTRMSIGASIYNLKPGSYTGHIELHPGSEVITVSLRVQLLPTCLDTKFDRISFIPKADAYAGGWTIEQVPDRIITLLNGNDCRAGNWQASSDANWLQVHPANGSIDRGGSVDVKAHVITDGLQVDTLYTGHLTFETRSSKTTVTVYVRIDKPVVVSPVCLTPRTSTLTFTSLVSSSFNGEGQNSYSPAQPADQQITVDNDQDCGEGDWTVSSDANWLVVKGGGHIKPGESATSNVHIDLASLDPTKAPVPAHLTFSSAGSKSVQVLVYLNFKQVNPPVTSTPVSCEGIVARTDTLNFTSNVSESDNETTFSYPADQTATIIAGKDCVPANWTVSSDANWLTVKGAGYIEASGTGNATVHVTPKGLDASKTYTGHLTFLSGSNKATVIVNLAFVKLITPITPMPIHVTPTPTATATADPTPVISTPTATATRVIPIKPIHVTPTPKPSPCRADDGANTGDPDTDAEVSISQANDRANACDPDADAQASPG